jgi:hypothetical protein
LAVAMRKRNLSVYDMQRELAAAGHTISINTLTVLLREEASRVCLAAWTTSGLIQSSRRSPRWPTCAP